MRKHGGITSQKVERTRTEGGHWNPERVVIIEFPSMAALNNWYSSPDYQPLIALRKACTSEFDMLFTIEGA